MGPQCRDKQKLCKSHYRDKMETVTEADRGGGGGAVSFYDHTHPKWNVKIRHCVVQ